MWQNAIEKQLTGQVEGGENKLESHATKSAQVEENLSMQGAYDIRASQETIITNAQDKPEWLIQ